MRFRFLPMIVAAALAVTVWATWIANDGRGLFAKRERPPDFDSVFEKLAETTSLAAKAMPLRDVLAQLSVRHRLDIQIDETALADIDVSATDRVTIRADELSLRAAVRNCLRLLHADLVAVVRGETLVVTVADQAVGSPEHFVGRVYTVAPLLAARQPISERALTDLITEVIQPLSWEVNGGSGVLKILPGAIAVAHTADVHAEIRQLLRQLEHLAENHDAFTPVELDSLIKPGAVRARRVLAAPIKLDMPARSPEDYCAELSKRVGVPILLDRVAIGRELYPRVTLTPGGSDTLVAPHPGPGIDARMAHAETEGIPLREALRQAFYFPDVQLVPSVFDEAIWITTPTRAARDEVARFYPVADLVFEPGADLDESYNNLFTLVSTSVAARQQSPSGNWPEIYGIAGSMLVFLPEDKHQKVEQLLRNLRAMRDPAAEPRRAPIRPPLTRAERVLAEQSGINARRTPLVDVVDYLRQRHEIEIVVDRRALNTNGIVREVPVTLKMEDVRLGHLLERMLKPFGLIVVADDNQLRITSSRRGKMCPSTLHDVRHLIDPDLGIADTKCLWYLVSEMTGPAVWDFWNGKGDIRIMGGTLAISQASSVNGEITALLNALTEYQQNRGSLQPVSAIPPDREAGTPFYPALMTKQVSFDLPRMPLNLAAQTLSRKLDLPIQVDETALEFFEVPPDVMVTPRARRMTCGGALESFVEHLGLTCVVRGGQILITAQEDPPESAEYCRVYPVHDLLSFSDSASRVPIGIDGLWPAESDYRTRGFGPPPLDFDSLIELIKVTVTAADWRGESSAGRIQRCTGALVIRQTWRAHRETERLLAQLRHAFWPEAYPDNSLSPVEMALEQPASVHAREETVDELLHRIAQEHEITILRDARRRSSNVYLRPADAWRILTSPPPPMPVEQILDADELPPLQDDDPFAGLAEVTSDIDELIRSLETESDDSLNESELFTDSGSGTSAARDAHEPPDPLPPTAEDLTDAVPPVARSAIRGTRWLFDRWQLELHLGQLAVEGESNGVPLGTGLRSLLRPLDLDICVYDESLRVGSYTPEHMPRITRVYDVGDLVASKEIKSRLTRPLRHESDPFRFPDERMQQTIRSPFGDSDELLTYLPPAPLDYSFCDVVVRNVFPRTWKGHGGEGLAVMYNGALVVVQSWPIHCEVQQFLHDLRLAVRDLPVTDGLRHGKPPGSFASLLHLPSEADDPRLQAYVCYLIEQTDLPATDVLPELLRSLERIDTDRDAVLHDMLCRFIGRYGPAADSAMPQLAAQLDRLTDFERRAVVVATLGRLGASAAPALNQYLARRVDGHTLAGEEVWHLLAALHHCVTSETADVETLLKLLGQTSSHQAWVVAKLLATVDPNGYQSHEIIDRWKNDPDEARRRLGARAEELLEGVFDDGTE